MKFSFLCIISAVSFFLFAEEMTPKEEFPVDSISEKSELMQSVLQGRLDTFRSGAVCSPLPDAEFQTMDQSVLYAWGMDYVCGNGIIEQDQNRIPTDEEIDWAIQHFSAKKLPFMWWTSAQVLETKGFQFGGILTGIALDIVERVPQKPPASSDLKIEIIQSESDVHTFTELAASLFAMRATATEQWGKLNASVMNRGEQVHFLARLNGVPVGSVTLSLFPSSAGIWNLATLPEYRKHGVGTSLVHAALIEAKKRHYGQVMAILMPKGMAWGLFTKLGFKEVCKFPFYVYGVAAEELEK